MTKNNIPVDKEGIFFKGYAPEQKQWVTGNLEFLENGDPRIVGHDPKTGAINIYRVLAPTITNHTGFSDRNGTMIFTGDIVKIDYISELKYIYSSYDTTAILCPVGYMHKNESFEEAEKIHMDLSSENITSHIEVTGTILETIIPSLMEEPEKNMSFNNPDIEEMFDDDSDYEEDFEDDYEEDGEYFDDEDDDIFGIEDIGGEIEIVTNSEGDENDIKESAKKVSEITEDIHRAISKDTTEWVEGHAYYYTTEDGEILCNIYNYDESEAVIHHVFPDTICMRSHLKDKNGKWIYSNDIVVIETPDCKIPMFVKYIKEIGWITDIYDIEKNEALLRNATKLGPQWEKSPKKIEVIGNLHTGIEDEYTESDYLDGVCRLDTDDELDIDSLDPSEIAIGDPNEMSSEELIARHYEFAAKKITSYIDQYIYGVRPDLIGWYVTEYTSTTDKPVIMCRWKYSETDELRMYINIGTEENMIYIGNYQLSCANPKNRRLVSFSANSIATGLDTAVNLLMNSNRISTEHGILIETNRNIKDYPMKKGITYDNMFKRNFKDSETISQRQWKEALEKCFTKKTINKISSRAYNTTGMWIHGENIETDDSDVIIAHNRPSEIYNIRTASSEYMTGSFCYNTFLLDKDDYFIYSSDIIEYEGKGTFVLYGCPYVDPNDPNSRITNEDGFRYLYYMKLDDIIDVISNKETDKTLNWKMVSFAEWYRNKDRLKVIGNFVDFFIENEATIINTKDYHHDEDPLQLVFSNDQMIFISEKDNNEYFKKIFDIEDTYHDNPLDFIELIYDMGIRKRTKYNSNGMPTDENHYLVLEYNDDYRIIGEKSGDGYSDELISDPDIEEFLESISISDRFFEMSDGSWVIQYNVECGENINMLSYQDINSDKFSIFIQDTDLHEGDLLTVGYDYDIYDVADTIKSIITDSQYTAKYTGNLAPQLLSPKKEYIDLFNKISDESDKSVPFSIEDIMTEVKKVYTEEEIDSIRCRAMDRTGRIMFGHPDYNNPTMFIDGTDHIAKPYIKESLSFNMFIIDCDDKFIFDNDIVMLDTAHTDMLMIIKKQNMLTLDLDKSFKDSGKTWKEFIMFESEHDESSRCVADAYSTRYEDSDLNLVQWVPVDYGWMIRNSFRLIITSNAIQDI